ncbi:MAG: nuclear transport factor 2 family protein [Chloroflexota bacterium]
MAATEHPNASAYRLAADAFRAGDLATVRTVIDDDVLWHVPGTHPMAGEIRGLDALIDWLGRLRALGFTLREHDVFGNDEHVCALSVMGARRPGLEVEVRVTSVFHFRAGKQVERWLYPDDLDAWNAIFGG